MGNRHRAVDPDRHAGGGQQANAGPTLAGRALVGDQPHIDAARTRPQQRFDDAGADR
jgi:hypothetical protein